MKKGAIIIMSIFLKVRYQNILLWFLEGLFPNNAPGW